MAVSATHNGWRRLLDESNTLAAYVNGSVAFKLREDSASVAAGIQFGTPTYTLAGTVDGAGISLATGYSASGSNRFSALEVVADTGSTDLTGDTYQAAIHGKLTAGTTQTNASLMAGLFSFDVGTVDLAANYFALRGHLDFWDNCTLSGTSFVGAVSAYVENEATTTVGASQHLDGVDIYQVGAPSVNASGFNSAVNIRSSATAAAWKAGIYTKATDVKQAMVILGGTSADTGTAGTILNAGTLAVPVDINTASAFGIKVFTRSTSTAAHTNSRFRAIGNAASGSPTIEGVLAQASVADAKYGGAVQGLVAAARIGSAAVMGGASSIITAGRFKTEDARATDGTSTAPTYAGHVYGIAIQSQISAAPTGDHVGIHFDCQTAAASTAQPWDAVFDFQIGGQNHLATNLFSFPSGGGWNTSGKMIVHGGAAAAAVQGYLHIAVNGTQYRIPYLTDADS